MSDCSCRRCVREYDPKAPKALHLFMKLNMVCAECRRRECPKADDHRADCDMIAARNALVGTDARQAA